MGRKTKDDLNDPIASAKKQYESAVVKLAELDAITDKMMNDKTSDGLKKGVTMEEFNESLRNARRQTMAMFGALDKWQYLIKHKDDPSTEPSVPTGDVQSVISASLSDKVESMTFSINHGLLASKLANAIKMDVEEAGAGDIPLCSDCA